MKKMSMEYSPNSQSHMSEKSSHSSPLVREFSKQIAGHSKEKGSSKPGSMLKHADGSLLKPILGPPRGPCELNFYKNVFEDEDKSCVSTDELILQLRPLVPEFRGFLRIEPYGHGFLKMEDLTENLVLPCILDVKMGARTYDDDASPEKIRKENEKYSGTKSSMGFCIPGMRVHQVSTRKNICYGKEFGKTLDENTIKDAFRLFLNSDFTASHVIQDSFLGQLKVVRSWFLRQTRYVFYASSLLLVYDAALICRDSESTMPLTVSNTAVQDGFDKLYHRITDVRMIDFAHVVPSAMTDSNYLNGLNNLIALFEQLRSEEKAC